MIGGKEMSEKKLYISPKAEAYLFDAVESLAAYTTDGGSSYTERNLDEAGDLGW